MMRRRKIPTPLTLEQVRNKLKKLDKSKLRIPKIPESEGIEVGGKRRSEEHFKNPNFSFIDLGGVFSNSDVELVDGNGKVYPHPGGYGFTFNWASEIGFGEFTVKRLHDGTIELDTERLGKEFLKKALCALIDKAKAKKITDARWCNW